MDLVMRLVAAQEMIFTMAREPTRGPPGLPGKAFDPIAERQLFRLEGVTCRAVALKVGDSGHEYYELEVVK
jgi:hypothetical protein